MKKYPIKAVRGNWEHWLGNPSGDYANPNQSGHAGELRSRRIEINRHSNRALWDTLYTESVRAMGDFTLFHGCSYSCHGNSDYRPDPWECYLYPRDLNIVTRGLFGSPEHLATPHFLFGHTHLPGRFVYSKSSMLAMWQVFTPDQAGAPFSYSSPALRFGINPGSAGIADEKMPRTALLLDTQEKTFTYIIDEDIRSKYERTFLR